MPRVSFLTSISALVMAGIAFFCFLPASVSTSRYFAEDENQDFLSIERPKYFIPREIKFAGGYNFLKWPMYSDPHFRASRISEAAILMPNGKSEQMRAQAFKVNYAFSRRELRDNVLALEISETVYEFKIGEEYLPIDKYPWILGQYGDVVVVFLASAEITQGSGFHDMLMEISLPPVSSGLRRVTDDQIDEWDSVLQNLITGSVNESAIEEMCVAVNRMDLRQLAKKLSPRPC